MAIEGERPVVLAAWIGTATLEGLCPALVARFQHLGDHGIQNGFHISHSNAHIHADFILEYVSILNIS